MNSHDDVLLPTDPSQFPPGGFVLRGTPLVLLAIIGRGGQGVVYKARNPELPGRFEAAKVLLDVRQESFVRRFRREMDVLSSIDHRSVVRINHVYVLPRDGRPVFTMEYVDGGSLKQRLEGGQPLPPREALRIAIEVADGLAAAHAKGVIHRDIKPGNILLAKSGAVKIIDFGVAIANIEMLAPTDQRLTVRGTFVGTAAYAPPELTMHHTASAATDLYMLGCVLFEMLTGKRPFTARSEAEYAYLHQQMPAPSLVASSIGGPFPPELEWLIQALLAKDMRRREGSAAHVRRQLEAILKSLPADAQISVQNDAVDDDITVASGPTTHGHSASAGMHDTGTLSMGAHAGPSWNPQPSSSPEMTGVDTAFGRPRAAQNVHDADPGDRQRRNDGARGAAERPNVIAKGAGSSAPLAIGLATLGIGVLAAAIVIVTARSKEPATSPAPVASNPAPVNPMPPSSLASPIASSAVAAVSTNTPALSSVAPPITVPAPMKPAAPKPSPSGKQSAPAPASSAAIPAPHPTPGAMDDPF
jgi:serine/threonine protein kinase